MKSDSLNSRKTTEQSGKTDSQPTLSSLFNWFLGGLFVFQIVFGILVIFFFIGGEMTKMQMKYVDGELQNRKQVLEVYLKDRLALLEDYAQLPILITGVMHPSANQANTVDFMNSLSILKEDAFFCLQDFEGNVIYATAEIADSQAKKGNAFKMLMTDAKTKHIDFIQFSEKGSVSPYWRLSVPVRYQGYSEGALTAFIPVSLDLLLKSPTVKSVRVAMAKNGKIIFSKGEPQLPVIKLQVATDIPGIDLIQEVSKEEVNRNLKYLISALVFALIIGTVCLMIIVQLVAKKILIVPHTRLQTMSDGLEKEVDKRTEELKKRSEQLSLEVKERREAETAAHESEKLVSALLEGIQAAFFILNPETGEIIRANPVVQTMFGLSPQQLLGRPCVETFPDIPEDTTGLLCPTGIGNNTYTEGVVHDTKGLSFPVARYLVPMEIKGERHIGIMLLNIAERKNLERRLNIAQKLESVGELASGIAHEINTPIQYIGDSIRFVEEAFEDVAEIIQTGYKLKNKCSEANIHQELTEKIDELSDDADLDFVMEEVPKACTRALEGTERVAVIVRAMKNFAHPGDGERKAVDINMALENTITVAKNEWKYVADVVTDFDSIPVIQCLPGDINQVFLNVLVNAAHAVGDVVGNSGEKGTITVSTRESDQGIIIKIADTGNGIPPENREKVFDPFFTTKDVGRGTGQGLAIVHDIVVERHGGSIDLESSVGKGTTFSILLPFDV